MREAVTRSSRPYHADITWAENSRHPESRSDLARHPESRSDLARHPESRSDERIAFVPRLF